MNELLFIFHSHIEWLRIDSFLRHFRYCYPYRHVCQVAPTSLLATGECKCGLKWNKKPIGLCIPLMTSWMLGIRFLSHKRVTVKWEDFLVTLVTRQGGCSNVLKVQSCGLKSIANNVETRGNWAYGARYDTRSTQLLPNIVWRHESSLIVFMKCAIKVRKGMCATSIPSLLGCRTTCGVTFNFERECV